MKFYTLTTIILISFVLNGCILDRIKQRIYAKKQIERQEQSIKKRESRATAKQRLSESKKVYKPSPATAPIYTDSNEAKNKKTKVSSVKRKKKYSKKRKHISKKIKLKPEPYSIEKNERDPELLGPQTTISSNPLTNNSKIKDSKKKKI